MPLAVAAVALTAGLGVATFVKAFGVGFLARPRSESAAAANGVAAKYARCDAPRGRGLHRPRGGAGGAGPALTRVLQVCLPCGTVRRCGWGDVAVGGDPGVDVAVADPAGLLVAALVVVALVRRGLPRRVSLVWGCGGTRLDPRMEYTATSFAEPLKRVFDDVLRPENDVDVTHHAESQLPDRERSVPAAGRPIGWRARCTRLFLLLQQFGMVPVGCRTAACTGTWATALRDCATVLVVVGLTTMSAVGVVVQVILLVVLAPYLVGLMRQVRARLEGRAGAGVGQPWRDLRKLLRKEPITPAGSSWVFAAAPAVLVATTLVIAAVAPVRRDGVSAGRGGRPVRGGGAAAAGHGRAGAGRAGHRHGVRRDGREPGDHGRRAGRADAAAGGLRAVGSGRFDEPGRDRRARSAGAGRRTLPGVACSPRSRWLSW